MEQEDISNDKKEQKETDTNKNHPDPSVHMAPEHPRMEVGDRFCVSDLRPYVLNTQVRKGAKLSSWIRCQRRKLDRLGTPKHIVLGELRPDPEVPMGQFKWTIFCTSNANAVVRSCGCNVSGACCVGL